MGTSLTGKNISATYLGLLKTTDNAVIGGTAKIITDGNGTDSPLYLSTTRLGIGITPTSTLHVNGDANINGLTVGLGGGALTNNIAFGEDALLDNTTGEALIGIGERALTNNTTGTNNIAIGFESLEANTTNNDNIGIGYRTLFLANGGNRNIAIGSYSSDAITTGYDNISIGVSSLSGTTTGYRNIAIGYQTINNSATAERNVAIGYGSHSSMSDGASQNISIGYNVVTSLGSGDANTSIGSNAGLNLTSGSNNVLIGSQAGSATGHTSYSNNVIIGTQANAQASGDSNEIVIGYNTTGNGSNTVTIGNSSITKNYFSGKIYFGGDLSQISNNELRFYGNSGKSISNYGIGTGWVFQVSNTTSADTDVLRFYSNGNAIIYKNLNLSSYGSGTITGTATQRLGVDSSGNVIEIPIGAGAVDGSGTAGKITKWSDSDTITDSIMSESGSTIEIGASTPILKFNNLAGGGLDPLLTASGTNFTISTSSLTPLIIALDTADSTFGGNILFSSDATISRNTSDGSDDGFIALAGGGANSDGRGARIRLYGNEHASLAGVIDIATGNIAGSDMLLSATDTIQFSSGGSEKMRLDASGTLLVGKTSDNNALAGTTISNSGIVKVTRTDWSLLLNRLTTDGNIALFQKDGTTIGALGSNTTGGQPLLDISANSTNGNMRFLTAGSERARIDSSGNFGLGVTSPYKKLEVAGDIQLDATDANMWIKSGATGTNGFINWTFNTDDTVFNKIGIDYDTRSSTGFHIDAGYPITIDGVNNINFHLSGSSQGTWDSTGLGIGITPSYDLHLHSTSTGVSDSSDFAMGVTSNDSETTPRVLFQAQKNGTNGGRLVINTLSGGSLSERMRITSGGDVLLRGTYNPYTSTNRGNITLNGSAGNIIAFTNNTSGKGYIFHDSTDLKILNAIAGNLIFSTNSTERARITSGGIFLVNQTVANSSADGFGIYPNGSSNGTLVSCYNGDDGTALRVGRNSDGQSTIFIHGSTVVGSISVTSSATAYNTSSDYRLKEDLQDFNALEIASKIKMYDFKWKENDTRSYGVIAHELEEVLPQAVTGEKDAEEMQQVDYSKLVPILLKSIQELEARVKELEKEI